jgi:predicted branched-subunit amino acid permease
MSVEPERATLTRAGLAEGVRLTLPLLPGVIVFSAAFGAAAAQKGLGLVEALAMSGFVFAGASQLVALEMWPTDWTVWAVLAVTAVTAAVNMRLFLMSAALRPWLAELPAPGTRYVALATLTDANWLIGMRYRAEGGGDLGIFLGAGLLLWAIWLIATAPGWFLGALIDDPKRFGLDLILPIFFAMMIVPLWRGGRDKLAWVVTGIVAVAVHVLAGGYWFIVAGALAGSLVAAFSDHDRWIRRPRRGDRPDDAGHLCLARRRLLADGPRSADAARAARARNPARSRHRRHRRAADGAVRPAGGARHRHRDRCPGDARQRVSGAGARHRRRGRRAGDRLLGVEFQHSHPFAAGAFANVGIERQLGGAPQAHGVVNTVRRHTSRRSAMPGRRIRSSSTASAA